mmetsp:Transcript_20010/g.42749  ORF Transcript_20010/g.42749 Transcript_20010/m.42749 type:complete len:391 (+) Transcript_20010:126-1298(+)
MKAGSLGGNLYVTQDAATKRRLLVGVRRNWPEDPEGAAANSPSAAGARDVGEAAMGASFHEHMPEPYPEQYQQHWPLESQPLQHGPGAFDHQLLRNQSFDQSLHGSSPVMRDPMATMQHELVRIELSHGVSHGSNGKLGLVVTKLVVTAVTDAKAAQIGFLPGDKIIAVNGRSVESTAEFQRETCKALQEREVCGLSVVFEVLRKRDSDGGSQAAGLHPAASHWYDQSHPNVPQTLAPFVTSPGASFASPGWSDPLNGHSFGGSPHQELYDQYHHEHQHQHQSPAHPSRKKACCGANGQHPGSTASPMSAASPQSAKHDVGGSPSLMQSAMMMGHHQQSGSSPDNHHLHHHQHHHAGTTPTHANTGHHLLPLSSMGQARGGPSRKKSCGC